MRGFARLGYGPNTFLGVDITRTATVCAPSLVDLQSPVMMRSRAYYILERRRQPLHVIFVVVEVRRDAQVALARVQARYSVDAHINYASSFIRVTG